jgi:hypothetical protein
MAVQEMGAPILADRNKGRMVDQASNVSSVSRVRRATPKFMQAQFNLLRK